MDKNAQNSTNLKLSRAQVQKELAECSESLNQICSKLIHLQNYAQVILNDLNKGVFIATYADTKAVEKDPDITPSSEIINPER